MSSGLASLLFFHCFKPLPGTNRAPPQAARGTTVFLGPFDSCKQKLEWCEQPLNLVQIGKCPRVGRLVAEFGTAAAAFGSLTTGSVGCWPIDLTAVVLWCVVLCCVRLCAAALLSKTQSFWD